MRKILSLFIVALFSASMWADLAYFVNVPGWTEVHIHMWNNEGNNGWPGPTMTYAGTLYGYDVYSYEVDSYTSIIFNIGSSATQTADLSWDASKPYFYPKDTYEGKYCSKWYTLDEVPDFSGDAFYITGNAMLVGGSKAWNSKAIKVTENSYKFENLAAGWYQLKVIPSGCWDYTNYGYWELTTKSDGLYADGDGNVCFNMAETGDVTVTFEMDGDNVTTFTVIGDYYGSKTKTVKFVPWKWAADDAKYAALIKGAILSEKWTPFFSGDADTLSLEISECVDSIKFVRFAPGATTPNWGGDAWNNTSKYDSINAGLVYTIDTWWSGTWNPYTPAITIKGQNTSTGTDVNLAFGADKLKPSAKANLSKGTYQFKVIVDGGWYTRANNGSPYGLHREHQGVANVTSWEATENINLTVDMTGEYEFTWMLATDSLHVGFPTLPDPAYYLTIGPADDETKWTNHAMTEDTGVWSVATDLVKTTANCQFKIFKNWPTTDKDNQYFGAQYYENTMDEDHCSNWDLESPGYNINITPNDKSGDYTFNFTPADSKLSVVYPSGTTAIDNTESGKAAVKRIVNGQLVIEKNGKTFNAIGVEVK